MRGGAASFRKAKPPSAGEVAAAQRLGPQACASLLAALDAHGSSCPVCADVPEDPLVSFCCHVFCRTCVVASLEGPAAAAAAAAAGGAGGETAEFSCPTCGCALRRGSVHAAAALRTAAGVAAGGSGGGAAEDGPPAHQGWTSSSKVDRLMALLEGIRRRNSGADASTSGGGGSGGGALAAVSASRAEARMSAAFRPSSAGGGSSSGGSRGGSPVPGRRPEKAIVFSQWTAMLDLLEVPLKVLGVSRTGPGGMC